VERIRIRHGKNSDPGSATLLATKSRTWVIHTPVMVDIRVLRIQLNGEAEVGKTELGVLGGILALLDVQAGPLDEGVHLHLGVRR